MKNTFSKVILTLLGLLLLLPGCASRNKLDSFLREEVNLAYVKSVGVLPFENNTSDPYAAKRCREILMTEVMASGLFEVVEKGVVDSALRTEAVDAGAAIDAVTLRRLGQRLGVEAFIMGSMDSIGESRSGNYSYTELTMSIRLVDSEKSLVLWQASGRGSGYSIWDRLFGLGSRDSFQITLELIRSLLRSMGERPA
ncbi:MAG: DUF799 family lipoprotein [Desulfuromonadaceae bacterium]